MRLYLSISDMGTPLLEVAVVLLLKRKVFCISESGSRQAIQYSSSSPLRIVGTPFLKIAGLYTYSCLCFDKTYTYIMQHAG